MIHLTTVALLFLAAGIFTSVSILAGYQVLFGISSAYFLYLTFKNKRFDIPKSAWFLIGFIVIALIGLLINRDVIPHFIKNFRRLKFYSFGIAGIFVFRIWLTEASDKTKKLVTNLFFVSMIVAGAYAIGEIFHGEKRATGLTETMRYGYGTGMILLTVLSAILHHQKTNRWINLPMAITAFVVGLIGMYLTYTRGALLGFLCGLPFVLYYYKRKLGIAAGSAAALVVIVLGSFYLFGSGHYQSRFLMSKNNGGDVIRRSQWQAAIIATKEKPILGWGLDNFKSQVKRIKLQHDLDAKEYVAHSHNQFLEIASGTGLIGLFFFLGWLLTWAIESFKADPLIKALIIPLGVAFIISSQFEATLNSNTAVMVFTLYSLSCYPRKSLR